jgi:hypothetical protein
MAEQEERYRWCVYCGADCWPDVEHQEHADDCPTVTGRHPIVGDPGLPDDHPAKDAPIRCARCPKLLTDHYRTVQIEGGSTPVYECVCDNCALADFIDPPPAQEAA